MKDREESREPSWGVISIARITGRRIPLFGSSIYHDSAIRLEISHAMVSRSLHEDSIMPDPLARPIVEIEMSMTQFAEAMTSFNIGEGTPCTITYINGKQIPEP